MVMHIVEKVVVSDLKNRLGGISLEVINLEEMRKKRFEALIMPNLRELEGVIEYCLTPSYEMMGGNIKIHDIHLGDIIVTLRESRKGTEHVAILFPYVENVEEILEWLWQYEIRFGEQNGAIEGTKAIIHQTAFKGIPLLVVEKGTEVAKLEEGLPEITSDYNQFTKIANSKNCKPVVKN